MEKIITATRALAIAYRDEANSLDEAWLREADPRAVEGGAFCAEANLLRGCARTLWQMIDTVEEA